MKLNQLSKGQSGLVILMVYLLAMSLGMIVYFLSLAFFFSPVWGMLAADVVMTLIVYLIGLAFKNASLYDPYWSVMPPFMALLWALTLSRLGATHIVILMLVMMVWAIRLTYNWWKNWHGFAEQDWRYDMLRDKNVKLYPMTNLVGIHMVPTLVVFFQMIVVYRILLFASFNIGFLVGALIALAAPIIQYFSDRQMYEFRQKNSQTKKVINTGLWRFSRHPNYFGELLFWVAIYVMYLLGSKTLDWAFLAPLSMIALFVFISVPMMEKKLAGRPGYDEYKASVSMIIPFFPKKSD